MQASALLRGVASQPRLVGAPRRCASRASPVQRCSLVARCTSEKVEERVASSSTAAPGAQGGPLSQSAAPVEEQERELAALQVLPQREARLETLALWVGAAVAFGGGVW